MHIFGKLLVSRIEKFGAIMATGVTRNMRMARCLLGTVVTEGLLESLGVSQGSLPEGVPNFLEVASVWNFSTIEAKFITQRNLVRNDF